MPRRPNRAFQFQKRGQLFIRLHNETPLVAAMCVHNPDVRPLAISESGDALRLARLALILCWRHTTFVRSGRSGRPRETKGVTVTVPLLTGREIRALKRPEASSV